jgi:hypothetical protein
MGNYPMGVDNMRPNFSHQKQQREKHFEVRMKIFDFFSWPKKFLLKVVI